MSQVNAHTLASTFAIRTKPTHKAKIAKELASQRTGTHPTSGTHTL